MITAIRTHNLDLDVLTDENFALDEGYDRPARMKGFDEDWADEMYRKRRSKNRHQTRRAVRQRKFAALDRAA